jgi:hypothetical protein
LIESLSWSALETTFRLVFEVKKFCQLHKIAQMLRL